MSSKTRHYTVATLVQVQQYFKDTPLDEISQERIADFYSMIDDNSYLYVSEPDKEWKVCTDEDVQQRAANEIIDILELDHSVVHEYYFVVSSTINSVCVQYGDMTYKDKVPFYISVLHRLLPQGA